MLILFMGFKQLSPLLCFPATRSKTVTGSRPVPSRMTQSQLSCQGARTLSDALSHSLDGAGDEASDYINAVAVSERTRSFKRSFTRFVEK